MPTPSARAPINHILKHKRHKRSIVRGGFIATAHYVAQHRVQPDKAFACSIRSEHLLPDPRQILLEPRCAQVLQQHNEIAEFARMGGHGGQAVGVATRSLRSIEIGRRSPCRQGLKAAEQERRHDEQVAIEQVEEVAWHELRLAAGKEEVQEPIVAHPLPLLRVRPLPCIHRVPCHIPHEEALSERVLHARLPRKGVHVGGSARVGISDQVEECSDFLLCELLEPLHDGGHGVLVEMRDCQGEENLHRQLAWRGKELVDEHVALCCVQPQHCAKSRVAHDLRAHSRQHEADDLTHMHGVDALRLQQVAQDRCIALAEQPLWKLRHREMDCVVLLLLCSTLEPRLLAAVGKESELLLAVQPVLVLAITAPDSEANQQHIHHLVPARSELLLLLHAVAHLQQALARCLVLVQQPEQPLQIPQDRALEQRKKLGQHQDV
mmetsp:Transcript_30899/g.64054  ORF Transcript_30899/g.64054 Transcript_30899/m.64054 type:complete len:436 (+) Transcript_30899:1023-2330(+)